MEQLQKAIANAKEIEREVINLKEENKKLKETNFKMLGRLTSYTEHIQKLDKQIESLQKDIVRKLDTNSRLREENHQLKIEFKKLFDDWALGNINETRFFVEYQKMIHKLQNS